MEKIQLIIEKEGNFWKFKINKRTVLGGFMSANESVYYPKETSNGKEDAKSSAQKYIFETLKEIDGQIITEDDIEYITRGE